MSKAKRITSAPQAAAQKLAWHASLSQTPLPMLKAAHAALEGHPDVISRERLAVEIEKKEKGVATLRGALAAILGG